MKTKVFFNLLSQKYLSQIIPGNTCIAEPKREVLPFTVTSSKKITIVKVNKDCIKWVFSLHSFSSFVKLKCSYKIIY